ncbi:MAG TPA: hypothetical protein VHA75_08305, partial [Rugosimonospora sp.]|nr:hypothetical protein [Rugosimonospora sp.]
DRLASSPTTPPPGTGPDPAAAPIRLHPTAGDLWLIGPAERAVPTRPLRGFTYLRHLLRRPGQPVPALDLVTAGQDTIVQPDLGPTLDRRAVTAYRHRLTTLADDIAEAERWSDIGRLELLHAERDALVHELSAATGLGGRARTTGSHQERARIAATKAITAAIDRITAIDEPAGRHLKASIHTGHHCAYLPDHAAPRWLLD